MITSDAGRNLIKFFEGSSNVPYRDTNGHLTIGVGHLLPADADPKRVWKNQQIDDQLKLDLKAAEDGINAAGVALSQPQFDALVSLAFNIGVGAFGASTVARELRKSRYHAAAEAILLWNNHDVLLPRRQAERGVFLYGTAP